jgi:hypothetical protein
VGNLSEHFDRDIFACKCGGCRGELKISLTLVGILEDVWSKFNQPVLVKRAYVCDQIEIEEPGPKRNYHGSGKALDITLPDVGLLPEVFRYLETFPEISGLGYDPDNSYIHLDLREKEPVKWLYQRREEKPLTAELRARYSLGSEVSADRSKKSVTIDIPVEI